MSRKIHKTGRSQRKMQCRLCGSYSCSALKNIFDHQVKLPFSDLSSLKMYKMVPLNHVVNECLNFEIVENSDLPAHVCKMCYGHLISWCNFKNDCWKQQLKFLNKLNVRGDIDDHVNLNISEGKKERLVKLEVESKQNETENGNFNCAEGDSLKINDFTKEAKKIDSGDKVILEKSEKYSRKENNIERNIQLNVNFTNKKNSASTSLTASFANCETELSQVVNSKSDLKKKTGRKLLKQDTSFACDKCPKVFNSKWTMRHHLETHNEVETYCCHICGILFRTLSYLQRHVRLHSLNKKTYCCQYCHKEFRQSAHLIHHVRIHTGEKPYKCSECQQTFLRKSQLMVHVSSVHKNEKKYICEICGKGFLCNANFKAHMLRHNGQKNAKCDLCNKSFVTNNALFRHQRFHTGEKPFICQVCGKQFADSSNKKKHMVSNHSGLKPNKRKVSVESKEKSPASASLRINERTRKDFTVDEVNDIVTVIESSDDQSVLLLAPLNGKLEEHTETKKVLEKLVIGSGLTYKNGEIYINLSSIPVISQEDSGDGNHIELPLVYSDNDVPVQDLNKASDSFVDQTETAGLDIPEQFEGTVQEADRLEDLLIFNTLTDNEPENSAYFISDKELFNESDSVVLDLPTENTLSEDDIESNYLDLVNDQQKTADDTLSSVTPYDAPAVLKEFYVQ